MNIILVVVVIFLLVVGISIDRYLSRSFELDFTPSRYQTTDPLKVRFGQRDPKCSDPSKISYFITYPTDEKSLLSYTHLGNDLTFLNRSLFSKLLFDKRRTQSKSSACVVLGAFEHVNSLLQFSTRRMFDSDHAVIISLDDRISTRRYSLKARLAVSNYDSNIHHNIYDISIGLSSHQKISSLMSLQPDEPRKYLMTFKGKRYLTLEGKRRWETEFLHDPKRGVIVVTTCAGTSNQKAIEENPILGFGCENDTKIFNNYDFKDLLNTTFSLVIHGRQPATFRFTEALESGTIPILYLDGTSYELPYSHIIDWDSCAVVTNSLWEIQIALQMSTQEISKRLHSCKAIYMKYYKEPEAEIDLFLSAVAVYYSR